LQPPRILAVKKIAILPLIREMPSDNDLEHWLLIEGVATNIAVLTGDDTDVFVPDRTGQGQIQALDPVGNGL